MQADEHEQGQNGQQPWFADAADPLPAPMTKTQGSDDKGQHEVDQEGELKIRGCGKCFAIRPGTSREILVGLKAELGQRQRYPTGNHDINDGILAPYPVQNHSDKEPQGSHAQLAAQFRHGNGWPA